MKRVLAAAVDVPGPRKPQRATAEFPDTRKRLGTKSAEFPTPSDLRRNDAGRNETRPETASPAEDRDQAAQARRARRYANRRTLWKVTRDRACAGCGRTVMDPDSGLILARTADGNAVALGLFKCGRIWLCPVCSAKIRNGRAQEISRGAVAWIERGGTVLFVTFTARHAAAHRLADLMDALQGKRPEPGQACGKGSCGRSGKPCGKDGCGKPTPRRAGAYQRLITGGTWAGRPERGQEGIRDRVGYLGMIRATEVTLGERSGWHPHIHALVFIGGRTEGTGKDRRVVEVFEPSSGPLEELEGHFRGVWTRHLRAVDPTFTPSDEHGVVFEAVSKAASPDAVAKYLAKLQEGKDPGAELARADMKNGRHGNVTPFQLLGRIGDLSSGLAEEDADGFGTVDWCLSKWSEYETATKGRRAIEWTRYLRPLLGLEGGDSEEDDMDLLFELDGASDLVAGVAVSTEGWHLVAGRALDLAATEAVETGRLGDVLELVTLAGGSVEDVRTLTGPEIREAWEAVLAGLAQRREAAAQRRAVEAGGNATKAQAEALAKLAGDDVEA